MATGAPGTNGVWQYGEDDSEATFSALLNKAASTTDTQIGADRTRLTALEARKLSGLVPVVPASISPAGGSASANSLGVVTFTGVTAISLNSVFTSSYKNYRIVINLTSNNALSCLMRMRASGADVTTATYNQAGYSSSGSTLSAFNATALTYVILFDTYVGIDTGASYDIFKPQLSAQTTLAGVAIGVPGGTVKSQATNFYHSVAAAYDGFSLITNSTNTITGTVQVFGYED